MKSYEWYSNRSSRRGVYEYLLELNICLCDFEGSYAHWADISLEAPWNFCSSHSDSLQVILSDKSKQERKTLVKDRDSWKLMRPVHPPQTGVFTLARSFKNHSSVTWEKPLSRDFCKLNFFQPFRIGDSLKPEDSLKCYLRNCHMYYRHSRGISFVLPIKLAFLPLMKTECKARFPILVSHSACRLGEEIT